MAASGAAETFGFFVNPGPRPNSPVHTTNITDTGRESFRTILLVRTHLPFFLLGFNFELAKHFLTTNAIPLNKNAVVALCASSVVHRRGRKCWMHPTLSEKLVKGKSVILHSKAKESPDKF